MSTCVTHQIFDFARALCATFLEVTVQQYGCDGREVCGWREVRLHKIGVTITGFAGNNFQLRIESCIGVIASNAVQGQ